jgi:hypothetical protein
MLEINGPPMTLHGKKQGSNIRKEQGWLERRDAELST